MAAKKAARESARGKTLGSREVLTQLMQRKAPGTARRKAEPPHLGPRVAAKPQPDRPAMTHKYQTGQTVTLLPNRYGANRNGSFEVVRLLPEEHGVNHYRLKSMADGHERIAGEDELA